MPRRPATLFFAWQSDTPANTNLSFIEKALREAVKRLHADATLELAEREMELKVDRDTKDVPGSPPIAGTILKKIEDCSAFIADLTLVGISVPGLRKGVPRYFPNPNVGIEYGYALKSCSHTRVIGVLNTAYGPKRGHLEKLPFDLRHLRKPITYRMVTGANAAEKKTAFDGLVTGLVQQLRIILQPVSVEPAAVATFTRVAMGNPGKYFGEQPDLVPERSFDEGPLAVKIPVTPCAHVRLWPQFAVPPIDSAKDARDLARKGTLREMGVQTGGCDTVRNALGAFVYSGAGDEKVFNFTQLFLSGEICGMDFRVVGKVRHQTTDGEVTERVLQVYPFELSCARALDNYSKFARNTLTQAGPWKVEAALLGMKGCKLGLETRITGLAVDDEIVWQREFAGTESVVEFLRPFYEKVCSAFGVSRWPEAEERLKRNFAE